MSGGVWLASYMVLWGAVGVLLLVVLALVRQVGVLHTRLDEVGSGAGAGAGDPGDAEAGGGGDATAVAGAGAGAGGPPLGSKAPMPGRVGYERSPLTLVAFTSASCELSQVLAPALRVVDRQYDEVRVVELPLGSRTIAAFEAFNVSHTPFVVAVGQDGRVRGRGRARNLQQLEMFVERALAVAAKAAGRSSAVGAAVGAAGAVVRGDGVVDLRAADASADRGVSDAAPMAEHAEPTPDTEPAPESENPKSPQATEPDPAAISAPDLSDPPPAGAVDQADAPPAEAPAEADRSEADRSEVDRSEADADRSEPAEADAARAGV